MGTATEYDADTIRTDLYHGYLNLGRVAMEEKDYAAAAESLKKSLQCDPNQFLVQGELAITLFEQKQFDSSLFHLQESLRLKPTFLIGPKYLGLHAWVRATSKNQAHYDPPKALSLALQGMEMAPESKRGAELLRALAAAYAANGNFPEAIENARLAVESAMSNGQKQMAREIIEQIKLYKNKKPYRE